MKKKLLCLLVSLALVLNISALYASSQEADFEVYRLVSGETDRYGNVYNDYYVDMNGNKVDLFTADDYSVSIAEESALPSKYSSVDEGIITTPKNQGGSSSCWAFSTVSALETSSIMQGFDTLDTADYSEAHLTWFAQNELTTDKTDPTYGDGRNVASPYITGGNWLGATAALSRGAGLQKEENAKWIVSTSESVLNGMNYPESERYTSYLRLKSAQRIYDTSRDGIKKAIMEHGSLMAGVYYDYDVNIDNYSYYYQNTVSGKTNHAITIVGWDDDFSKTNFKVTPQPNNDGAWLCKNSWGTRIGVNGYFWLSYEETSHTNFISFEAMEADDFENIYQYDGTVMKYIFRSTAPATAANTFTAKRDEMLTHVGFFSGNDNADAVVRIYKGRSANSKNPTVGNLLVSDAVTEVKDIEYGYSTVKLEKGVYLEEGETFTVCVTFTANAGQSSVLTEGETTTDTTVRSYTGNPGESFVCLNGVWYDTSSISGKDYNNVSVKAMTLGDDGLPGDADSDEAVTLKDVVFIRRYLAGGYSVKPDIPCSDVDGDGEVTLADSVILTRYLAGGYDVTLK